MRSSYEDETKIYIVMDLMVDDLRNIFNSVKKPLTEKYAAQLFY